jgi:hypothetical protein
MREENRKMERKAVSVGTLAALLILTVAMAHFVPLVEAVALLQITTDKSVYALGEEVKVTLKNIGDAYVEMGGYPSVTIYTYPALEPVWPTVFAFLLWGLAPGESETWTWNQYNEYAHAPATPGMYIVKVSSNLYPSSEVFEAIFQLSSGMGEWVPYVPQPDMVDLVFWTKNQISYINATITFGDAGYLVTDWGTVVQQDFEIWADAQIWDWTGPAALVITTFRHTYDLGILNEGTYTFAFKAWNCPVKSISFIIIRPVIEATIDADPDTLNLKSQGEWISTYIELPTGYDVNNIGVSTIRLNDILSVDSSAPSQIGDHDVDGIPDLMVKFNRAQLESYIYYILGVRYGQVTLTVTGQLFDGTIFKGSDTIKVNFAGDVNNDGTINIVDAGSISAHWHPGPPIGPLGYDANADLNQDATVNINDAGILSANWGQAPPPTFP